MNARRIRLRVTTVVGLLSLSLAGSILLFSAGSAARPVATYLNPSISAANDPVSVGFSPAGDDSRTSAR